MDKGRRKALIVRTKVRIHELKELALLKKARRSRLSGLLTMLKVNELVLELLKDEERRDAKLRRL